MEKIRTLVAHNDEKVKNEIIQSIKTLDFVELIGTANNGKETFDKIIDLKPEMVFAKFDMEEMNGLEIIKKSKKNLENNSPVFNFIEEDLSEDILKEALETIGIKMNALVMKPYQDKVINILEEYKDFKNEK